MKNKVKVIAAVAALAIAITPMTAQAKYVASSFDDIFEGEYDPEINYAFPNNENNPFSAVIREEGYYAISTFSPGPTEWIVSFCSADGPPTVDGEFMFSFSGKSRYQIIYCRQGCLKVYGNNSFFVTLDSIEKIPEKTPGTPVRRFYNSTTGEHFFTTNLFESYTLVINGWTYEGIAFESPNKGAAIYRNYDGARHSYTYDYRPDTEGLAFYLPDSAHRLISPDGDTVITENEREYWDLLHIGWEDRT